MVLCQRIAAGRPVAHVAAEMGISRTCAYRWWGRYRQVGLAGLVDRPSCAHHHPRRTSAQLEAAVVALRQSRKLGPARPAGRPAGLDGLPGAVPPPARAAAAAGPASGQIIRRYERAQPGELIHMDVKKLGRLREGGGHRVHGRDSAQQRRRDRKHGPGYDDVHAVVDDHSRLAYAEVLSDERGDSCAGFLRRAGVFFAGHGITIQRVLTDNAFAYRHSRQLQQVIAELGAVQRFTRPYRPQTNGKVERFNRTLLTEWAYVRPYTTNSERTAALDHWLHLYNYHRAHTALGGQPPISRVNNAPNSYS
jgi:transposase InsO family protein